jgi:hypothetical protein
MPLFRTFAYKGGQAMGMILESSVGLVAPSLRRSLNRFTYLMRHRRGGEAIYAIRRRLSLLLGFAPPSPLAGLSPDDVSRRWAQRIGRGIDARTERLTDSLSVVPKQTLAYPSQCAVLVSVIVPCFNYGRYLPAAVASALTQTLGSVEVIVVDDGSTDPQTHAVLDALEREGRCQVVRQQNAGLSCARNKGIALAHGEYICCLDADDELQRHYVFHRHAQ